MITIREWCHKQFWTPEPKLIIECGSYIGDDTAWLADLPGARVWCFEPDERLEQPARKNVTVIRAAIGAVDGRRDFIPSLTRGGKTYRKSGSVLRPTGHLRRHPDISFGWPVPVQCMRLDTFAEQWAIGEVALLWADVQGAEAELIEGAQELLRRTSYLYTEYEDEAQYEGQPSLAEILLMLPDWSIVHRWPNDVLLQRETG